MKVHIKKNNLAPVKLFKMLNSNKKSDLTFDELKTFCTHYGITESEFEVKMIFGLFDANKSFRISEGEFVKELELMDYRPIFVIHN